MDRIEVDSSERDDQRDQQAHQGTTPPRSPDELSRMMEREEGPTRDREVAARSALSQNGHIDERKRMRYLIIFTISMFISLTGLGLILVWIFKLRPKPGLGFSDSDQLTNIHPILMYTFMGSLNMYSVLVFRTHYDKPKGFLKYLHAGIMGSALLSGILGVVCIFIAHQMANGSDWYSLHSWIGTFTLSLFLCQFLVGFWAFLKPGLALSNRIAIMPWHRFNGAILLVLASLSVITGIAEFALFAGSDYKKFGPITFVANSAGMCVVLSALGLGYLLTEPSYKRPHLSEELPLKR